MFTTIEENVRGRLIVTVLRTRDFLARQIIPRNKVNLWRKKEKQLFSKIVRVSKLTKQRTLQINNSHLDGSRC